MAPGNFILGKRGNIDIRAVVSSILASMIIALCVYLFWPSNIEVGRVEYKQVEGVNGRNVTTLIHQTENDLKVEKVNFEINTDSLFLIDSQIEQRILNQYEKIRYLMAIRLCKNDELYIYYADKNDFNSIAPGILVKFKIDKSADNLISELIEY